MHIKEVRIGKAMTLNLGNYESARFEVAMVADVNDDDDADLVTRVLSDEVNKQLRKEARGFLKDRDAEPDSTLGNDDRFEGE